MVDEIYSSISSLVSVKGDVATRKKGEKTVLMLEEVNAKLDAIIKHLNIVVPVKADTMDR